MQNPGNTDHLESLVTTPLRYFSQPAVLEQIGARRLGKFLDGFSDDIQAANVLLPKAESQNGDYLNSLAAVLGAEVLPERLRAALSTLENAASPENQDRLDSTIQRRIPNISLSNCPVDRALELWFLVPEELSQFQPNACNDATLQPCNAATLEPVNASRLRPCEDVTLEPCNDVTSQPCHDSTLPRSDAQTLPRPGAPPTLNSQLSTSPTDCESFTRLSRLPPADYDRARRAEAKRLGIRVETLDAEVAKCRQLADEAAALDSALSTLHSPLVWPEPVDGAQVLDQVSSRFSLYVKLPPGAADALALWDGHSHAFAAFALSPRLNLSSSESGCGKTTTLDLLAAMTPRPLRTESLTAPVLFRLVDQRQPILLLDEVDTFLPQDEELRGLLNAGHKRGGCAYRCEGSSNAVRAFKAFGPAVLSGIGPLPATLHDRSICIHLVKAEENEVTAHFDELHAEIELELCRKLARWTLDNFAAIQACDPPMPKSAFNRLGDNWRPLFAIAQIAGGDWPARVLAAFAHLSARSSPPINSVNHLTQLTHSSPPSSPIHSANQLTDLTPSQLSTLDSQLLLSSIRSIFVQSGATRISSKQLVAALQLLPDRPWSNPSIHQSNNPSIRLTARLLALRLRPFGIHPHNIQIDGRQSKGYDLTDFTAAF